MTKTEFIIALRGEGYRVTAYDYGKETVLFCLGVILDEPIDIWHVSQRLSERGFFISSPYWDECNKTLYFPALDVDAETFKELQWSKP